MMNTNSCLLAFQDSTSGSFDIASFMLKFLELIIENFWF